MSGSDTLANFGTSLSILAAAIDERVNDGSPAHEAFTECVDHEARRLGSLGQDGIAGTIGWMRMTGCRILKEGW